MNMNPRDKKKEVIPRRRNNIYTGRKVKRSIGNGPVSMDVMS